MPKQAPKLALQPLEFVQIEPLRLTIHQAAQMLAISPAQIYRRLQSGDIKGQKDGASTYILPDELRRYVATRAELQLPDPQMQQMSQATQPRRLETRARKRAAAAADAPAQAKKSARARARSSGAAVV
jgi:hypothetical protein